MLEYLCNPFIGSNTLLRYTKEYALETTIVNCFFSITDSQVETPAQKTQEHTKSVLPVIQLLNSV